MFMRTKSSALTTPFCRKHRKHKQSPGVCSLCLAEKLAKLSSTDLVFSCRRVYSEASSCASSTQLSYSSSSDVSSCASPDSYHRFETTTLKNKGKKEKSRFWSKLLIGGMKRKAMTTGKGYFHGQFVMSHSEPLRMNTTSSSINRPSC